ncbi:uncharacterized protein MONOS_4537 [Monocercomonoides exilis]|uniref:uncharacterized protein n=1 Tax=Monocercomonoides exilis TaxID=2049356 RepID=UPI00355A1342|nr:hypothetical protein MONOS_4537 [Monocercomonoides exilis]|eukprot:MONOS_4537.1-p1 / transcript=MONOS_4537.1 / gene=MONOS_4537 / organism=Monocercomonoides_exilis_PA203 / gene_product=unspecified product / transcript_product=unspecified product / location=Mono_scaffold00121:107086-111216(+) / protein_length=1377 / sequence_SO=supercontig / SO=protein_coding / is_pseudo=false
MIIKDSNSDLLLGSDTLHSLSNENEKLASFSNCLFINNSAASKKGDDVFLVSSSLFNDKSETSRTGRKVHNSINISEKVNFHDCFASNQELYYAVSHIPIDNKHSSVFFMSSVESESLVMENFIKHQNAVKVDPENGQDDAEACIIGGEKPCQTIEYAIEEAGKNNKKKQETPGKTTDTLNSPDISTKQERIIGMRSNESRRNIPLVISLSKADHIVVKKIDICDGIAVLSGNDKSNKTKNPDEQKEQKVTLHLNISKSSASSSLRYSKNYDDFISSDSFFDETLNQSKLQRMTFNRLRKQFEFASQNDERAETEGDSAGPKDSTGKEGSPEGQQQSSHRHQDAAVTVGDGQFKIEFMDIVAEAAKQKHSSGYSARSHANTDEQTKLLISLNPTATNASSTPLLHLLNVSITLSDQLPSTFLLTYPLLSSAGGVLVMDNTSISGFSFQNYPLILFTSDVISSSTPSSSSSSFVSSSIRSTQNPSTSLLYRPFLRINSSTISNIVRHRGDGAAVSALIGKGVKAEIDNTLISDCSVQLGSSGACLFYLEKGASLNIPGSKSEEGKEGNNEEKYGLVVKSCSAQEFGGGVSVVLDDGDEEAPQSDRNDQAESTNEKEDKEIDEKALDNLDEPKVAEDKRITLSLSSLSFSQCSAQKGGNFFVLWTHLPSITPASPSPSFDGSTSAFSLASSSSDQSEAQPYFYLSSSLNSSLSFIQKLNGITSRDLLCLFNPKQQKNWSQADLYALLAPLSVVYVGKAKEGAEKEVKCNETTEEVPCLKVNEAVNELLKMKGKKKVVVVSNDAELLDDKVVIDCATVEGKDEMKELKIVEKKITENEDPTIGSFLFDCKNDANFTSLKIALNEKVQKREAFFGCIHGCLTLIRVQLLHPFVQKVNSASLNAHSSALVYEPLSFMKAIELHFGFLQVDGCSFSFPSCSNSIGSTLCAISSHISINSTVFTSPSSPPSSSSSSSFSSSSIIMPSLPFSSSFSSVSLPLSSQSAPSHTFVCATDSFSWNSSQLFLNNSVTHISNTAIKGNANGAIFISSGSLALTNASFTENNPLLDKYPSFRRNLMCENGAVDMKSAGEGDGKKSDDCLWFMSDNCKMKGVLEQKDSFFFIPQLLNVEMELLKEEEKSDDKKTRKQKVPLLHLLSAQNDEKEKEKEEKEKEKPKEQNAIVKLIGKNFIPCNAILEIIIGYESTQTKSLWKINVQNETYATTVIPISAIQVPKTQRNSFPSSLSAPSSSLFYSLNSSEDLSSSSSTNSASGKSISSNGASISVHMLFWVDEMSKKRTRTYTMKNGKYFIAPSTEDDDADDLSYTSVLWYVTFVAMCAFSVAAVLWRFKLKRDEKNRGQNSEREANFSSLEEAHAKLSLRKD